MFYDEDTKLGDYDSETDVTDMEDIYPTSKQAQNVEIMQANMSGTPAAEIPRRNVSDWGPRTAFRPVLDVPKARSHSTRFNRIRHIKVEEIALKIESKDGSEDVQASSVSEMPTSSSAVHTTTLRPKRESSVKSFKVEQATAKKKKRTHEHTLGPSMSDTAVDFRQRRVIETEYKQHLATLLDDNVVQEVEEEGGITPLGRLFKAAVRMLERVHVERKVRTSVTPDVKAEGNDTPIADLETMCRRAIKAEEETRRLKSALRDLLESSG